MFGKYFHCMLMFMLMKIISGSLDIRGSGALWWGEGQADCEFKIICLFTDCLHAKKMHDFHSRSKLTDHRFSLVLPDI